MRSFLISILVMSGLQGSFAAEPSTVSYNPDEPSDYAVKLQGFPGYSKKRNRIIYMIEVPHGSASSEFFDLNIVDAQTLQKISSYRLDTRPTVKGKQEKLKSTLVELGKILKVDGYEQMVLISKTPPKDDSSLLGKERWGNAPKSAEMTFEYAKENGLLKILNSKSKMVLGKKVLQKLKQDCGPNGAGTDFPNEIHLWSTNEKNIFVIETALVGAADSCIDSEAVEIMKSVASGR